jgi:hypothetical protein
VETLDIGTIFEKSCYSFPIAGSVFFDQHFKFFVLIVGPPPLLAFVEIGFAGHVLDSIHDLVDDVLGTAIVFVILIEAGEAVLLFFVEVFSGLFEDLVVDGF